VDLEQPRRSQSWSRSASLQRIKEQTYETLVSGCAYGLRCPRSGLLLPKVGKICSTDAELQKAIGKRCSNRPSRHGNHEHGEIIGGKVAASTAFYPAALRKAWAKHILRAGGGAAAGSQALLTCDSVANEQIYADIAGGDDVEPDDQAESDEQIYTDIAGDDDVEPDGQAESDDELGGDNGQELAKDGGRLSTKEEQEIEHGLGWLHRNLGHLSARTMVKILKNSVASLQVLKMAKNFKCHACNSSVLPKAVRTVAGIEIPEVFEVMGSDGLKWTDPKDDAIYLLTLNLDEGSGLALVTDHGDKSQRSGNRSAADVFETWRSWADHYRAPRLIRCDAEGCHRADLTKGWCSSRGIEMSIAPGEAHWLMGKVERRTQLFKRALTKFRKQNYDCDIGEAISQVIHAISDLDRVGSHSPYAHAFGIGGAHAERMVVELTNVEKSGASMSDLMEAARRGAFEGLTDESRPAIQHFEPQTVMPPETQADATAAEPMEDEAPGLEADAPGPYSDTKGRDCWDQANSEDDLFVDVNTLRESGLAAFEFLDENMTVYFEMLKSELADSQGGRRLASQMLDCFVANQKRKDKIEFHRGKLSPSEKVEFQAAMTKEVIYWKQYKGLRPVPASEVKNPADAIRNILLTIAAANHWNIVEGDLASAFPQAYDLKKDLFVEADEALSSAFGVQPGEVLRVLKPGYGIGEAPRKWRLTAKSDFAKLKLQACDLEPPLWCLRCPSTKELIGLVARHVGDFVLCGDRGHSSWKSAIKGIRELYARGTWEDMEDGTSSIEQRGAMIKFNEKGIFQHQRAHTDKLKKITPKYPKARSNDKLTGADQSTLRTWCGALSWLGVNTPPWASAWVADAQSKSPAGDYKLFNIANSIANVVMANRNDGIQIIRRALPGCQNGPPDSRACTWCDAAWASRPGGHSRGGRATAPSSAETPFRDVANFTVLDWESRKLKRVARSSLAAEIQDVLATLATDCKAFYDGVAKSEPAGLGLDERRTAIEALVLRRALEEGGTSVRRVRSHAQRADGMAKASLQAFNVPHAFLMHQRWNSVHGERFLSARKRSALGKGIFDETNELGHSQAKEILESRKRGRSSTKQTASGGADADMLELISSPPV
ncbi:unnamed protein product, partial [Prorocentrum cordatum]